MTKTKKTKPQQLKIAGTERKTNPKIDKAAERYVDKRDTRMEQTKAEKKAHDELLGVMKAEGVTEYVYETGEGTELRVKLNSQEKVSVKQVKQDGDDEE